MILPYLQERFGLNNEFYIDKIKELEKHGYVKVRFSNDGKTDSVNSISCDLTDLGRSKIKIVLVGGVFDLLHPGHIYTLRSAKSLGDLLVVIVATTSTALKLKKNRKIYHDEIHRQELVSSLSFVDLALIGKEGTLYDSVSFVKPDIIALGYDQSHDEKEIQKNCLERGINLQVIRLTSPIPAIKSTLIKKELGNSFYDI
ncbi:MAG: FAD synthase [Thermoproteota archaeon]|nr:FAD synthase [Thermoproteota archaeon]